MAQVNPEGTMFLGLIEELIDLTQDSNVSNILVVMGSYEVDEQGKQKLVDGKATVIPRGMNVRGMNKAVQEELRKEMEAEPLAYLMILWVDRSSKEGPFGIISFDPETKQKSAGVSGLDHFQKSILSDYLNGLVKKG